MRFRSKFFGMGLLVLMAIAVLAWMVMALWNWVVPALFVGARSIDYARAVGLLVLSRILFGGFRGRGGWHGNRHRYRWERMTPEERENLKNRALSGRGESQGDRT